MRRFNCWLPIFLVVLITAQAAALDRRGYDELGSLMDSARLAEANIFAPKTWEKALEAFGKAEMDLGRDRNQQDLDKHVGEAREYTENAVKATEVAKLSLREYLEPRDKAKTAKAPTHVPTLYATAEEQFMKATKKVEEGNVKDALKEAGKSTSLFDIAEMEAIRMEILGTADTLIAQAEADEARKYALSTLDKAHVAREKSNTILTADRYNRLESVGEAKRAEYEARHASNIAQSVRSLNRNDQAWEKLMLIYEIQMNRVGQAFGLDYLPFDAGPLAAADTLLNRIQALQAENSRLNANLASISSLLGQALTNVGASPTDDDALVLAEEVHNRTVELAERVESGEAKLAELTSEREELSSELADRRERERKFKTAKVIISPAEGTVLYNATNDIVLRLHGLSFAVGKSDISDEHILLLEKVKQVLGMFPEARIMVEGHTDASGDTQANLRLSEKRAYAVMQYLRQNLLIPADRIDSMGYGSERPVASNQTTDGRAKNRRIDIIIMQ